MNIYKKLSKLSIPGIYALECPRTRSVYLGNSTDCLGSLSIAIRALNDKSWQSKPMIRDRRRLEFKLLEEIADYNNRNLRMNYWIKYYKDLGYQFYRQPKALIYKPIITVNYMGIRKYKWLSSSGYKAQVVLRSRGNRSVIVGIFDSMEEAVQFKDQYYSGDIYSVIYANNELTKNYLSI